MKNLNYILNNKNLSDKFKSINDLHIVKFHYLYTKKNYIKKIFDLKLISIFTNIFNLLDAIFRFENQNKNRLSKRKVLIVSHFSNYNLLNAKSDFYFGNLEKILKENKISFYKIMINHTKYNSSNLNKKINLNNQFILEKYLNLFEEGKILLNKLYILGELLLLFYRKKINLKLFFKLLYSLFEGQTSVALRMHYQIKRFVKKLNPEHCLLTYEGYSWERMCINGAKTQNPNINCIGFQHTTVTHNHYSIFKKINGNFNLDQIWCSQLYSLNLLKKKIDKFFKKKIYLVGNFHKFLKFKKKKNNQKKFLVIPEGIYSECEALFQFSHNLAKRYKDLVFIWRVHPVIDIERVLKNLKLNKEKMPKNIKISNNNFDQDNNSCHYVMYRGSSAVLKSVSMGNYPLFYNDRKQKNFDPLSKFFNKKNYFKDEKTFLSLIKNLQNKNYKKQLINKVKLINKDMFIRLKVPQIKKNLNIK
jgi:hypothetical protein